MKLRVLSILIFLFLSYNINAQWNFGIKSGLHFAKLNFRFIPTEFKFNTDDIITFEYGILTEHNLRKSFGLRSELNFIQKGGKTKEEDFGRVLTVRNYEIEASILLNYHIPINKFSFYLGGGGFIGYSLNGTTEDPNINPVKIDFNDEDEGYSRKDLGVAFGGGISYKLNESYFFLESRNRYSLNDFVYSEIEEDFFIGVKNLGFSIILGYTFDISSFFPQ